MNVYGKELVANILLDERMRAIGFNDRSGHSWSFVRAIEFPKLRKFIFTEMTFFLDIHKETKEIRCTVIDDDFCQPYDFEYILSLNEENETALIVSEQVDKWIEYLISSGVLLIKEDNNE